MSADLVLLHAPAVFDFRDRGDLYFPYLSTSGDVPITPLYEYFPLGFKTLQRYLGERGHSVEILNLCTVLLRYPRLDLSALFGALDARLFGIDLHWMVHVQGSLEIARKLKTLRPEVPVLLGGISSTYYADELIRYPFVDMVMRGYDTHQPMATLLDLMRKGDDPSAVPNLLWKRPSGEIVANRFTHLPDALACGVDWGRLPPDRDRQKVPILELLSTQSAGCSYDCHWCGGSRRAFRRVFGRAGLPRKPRAEVAFELETLQALPDRRRYHLYSVGSYNETEERLLAFIDGVEVAGLKSVSYEQYRLPADRVLKRMAQANPRTTITLSPESHDVSVARLAGRGIYDMPEMESWIERALDLGIHQVAVWFFIGMPGQDERSVFATVDYCGHLLRKFAGRRVVPLLCPMIPFLDPASSFFENPGRHGYRVFHRTVEEHRCGMERASLINRMNYETRWLSRANIVRVGYRAVSRLVALKGESHALPAGVAESMISKIDDALTFVDVVHSIDDLLDARVRERELAGIADEIRRRNAQVFFGGVSNQAFPISRAIGGRWFDEMLWSSEDLERAEAAG